MGKNINVREYDALVIGAGISGLLAARELARVKGRNIAIICDGAGASPYVHGFNMPLLPEDSPELLLSDMLRSGYGQNTEELAKTLCFGAKSLIPDLERMGIFFDKNEDGSYSLLRPLGASVARVASSGNHTGVKIINALKSELAENPCVEFFPESRALRLLTEGNRVKGALVADGFCNIFSEFCADVTVLACGGYCNIYPFSTNSRDIGGDGTASALLAGAALTDMEFIQFEPSAAVAPKELRGKSVITTMYYEGAVLRNANGERFMLRYSDKGECVDKDVQARYIYKEIKEGRGTENGGVFFDATGVGREKLEKLYPSYVQRYADVGIDIATTPFEIAPAPHTSLGGVMIDAGCAVKGLEGLFACGEVTGGLHGANRIGGNAGLEIQVFGNIAGKSASEYLKNVSPVKRPSLDETRSIYARSGEKPVPGRIDAIRTEMQDILSSDVSILRNAAGLGDAVKRLGSLLEEVSSYGTDGNTFFGPRKILRLENDLVTSIAIAKSALLRDTTCGCHVREDSAEDHSKYRTTVKAEGLEITAEKAKI